MGRWWRYKWITFHPSLTTGTKHDLILSERGIVKEGENAGKETLSRIGYYSKFEHLVKELCNREILLSQAQTLQDIRNRLI